MADELKYHYSNPKFEGLPWTVNLPRRKKRKSKAEKRKKRKERQYRRNFLKAEKKGAEGRCRTYLKEFWPKFSTAESNTERLFLLTRAANPGWGRVTEYLRKALRKEFQSRYRKLLTVPIEQCPTCGLRPKEKHHVIPLAFGGINEDINLILICMACHDEIHPWMKDKPRPKKKAGETEEQYRERLEEEEQEQEKQREWEREHPPQAWNLGQYAAPGYDLDAVEEEELSK